MDKFYKKIQDKLNHPADFSFDENQWELLQEKLDQHDKRNNNNILSRILWALLWLLPLLLMGGFLSYYVKNTNQQLIELQTKLDTRKIIHRDTSYQYHAVHQYDTIYHITTVYKTELVQKSNTFTPNYYIPRQAASVYQEKLFFDRKFDKGIFNVNPLTGAQEVLSLGELGRWGHLNTTDNEGTKAFVFNDAMLRIPLEKIDYLGIQALIIPQRNPNLFKSFEFELPTRKYEQREADLWTYLQPTGFRLGANLGLPFRLSNQSTPKLGLNIGGNAEVLFGQHFSLQFRAGLQSIAYQLREGSDLMIFPMVEPTNVGNELNQLSVRSRYFQIPFGFKYRFGTNKRRGIRIGEHGERHDGDGARKWRSNIATGLVAKRLLKHTLSYEFGSEGEENRYVLNNEINGSGFDLNTFYTALGLEYSINKNWEFYMNALYMQDFKLGTQAFQKNKNLSFESGILFNF